jgi:hypothetical protein
VSFGTIRTSVVTATFNTVLLDAGCDHYRNRDHFNSFTCGLIARIRPGSPSGNHRLLGFPVFHYIDMNDSEDILRAIRMTDSDVPIDLALHTPGGLVLAPVQIARVLREHPAKVTAFVPHYAMSGWNTYLSGCQRNRDVASRGAWADRSNLANLPRLHLSK